jgi:hypothetical protein
MKNSKWDILTGIVLLGILCLIAGFGAVLLNPSLSTRIGLGPTSSQGASVELVPTISLPTSTATVNSVPPTWTPTPNQNQEQVLSGQPTLRPSSTPVPTFTVIVLPTFTPTKKPAGSGVAGMTGGSCSVVYQNPEDESTMTAGTDFTTRWTLKNTSSTSWAQDAVDVRVASGDRLHTGADVLDLPYSVAANGGMVDILIPMEAPDAKGKFTENWVLVQGSKQLCAFFVTIVVK